MLLRSRLGRKRELSPRLVILNEPSDMGSEVGGVCHWRSEHFFISTENFAHDTDVRSYDRNASERRFDERHAVPFIRACLDECLRACHEGARVRARAQEYDLIRKSEFPRHTLKPRTL